MKYSPWTISNRNSNVSPSPFFLDIPIPRSYNQQLNNYQFQYYSPLQFQNTPILPHQVNKQTRRNKFTHSLNSSPRNTYYKDTSFESHQASEVNNNNSILQQQQNAKPLCFNIINRNNENFIQKHCIKNALIYQSEKVNKSTKTEQKTIKTQYQTQQIANEEKEHIFFEKAGAQTQPIERPIINKTQSIRKQSIYGRKVILIVVKDVNEFQNLIINQQCFHQNLKETINYFKSRENIAIYTKLNIFIMNIEKALFLTFQEKEKVYKYLANQRLQFAFQYSQMLQLAEQAMVRKSEQQFSFLYDHEFKEIEQTHNNELFYNSCPQFLYVSNQPLEIESFIEAQTIEEQIFAHIQTPKEQKLKFQEFRLDKIPDRSEVIREAEKQIKKRSTTPLRQFKLSYLRNFKIMKIKNFI